MQSESESQSISQQPAIPPPNIEFKALVLVILMAAIVCASLVYVMYARGVFESTQQVILIADDSEGVIVGMDLSFSGFPIGRVRLIELSDDGKARIVVDVARKDAKWIRTSSVFTMERGMVGDTRLRVFTGVLADPPLPDGSIRTVLLGDATAEIPHLVDTMRSLLENLENMTKSNSSLTASLDNVQAVTQSLRGPYGGLGIVLGSESNAKKIITALDHVNTLLAKTDTRVFGVDGVMDESRAAIAQVNVLLSDVRTSLKNVDIILAQAQVIGSNVEVASVDLGVLREQVEASLRKVEHLVSEINRKWPLSRDTELKLP
jgi:phospholipid/cholesterol/gamma-HCH transport system substrate-binding protein